ncbi:MAG: TrkH family potassium uptake protein [Planctomycetota bacterium]|jgi:trk system potassium uptake protein TrkH|nr:TrkH family potassium uptake protein [Planctomycetota bacterium]
MNFQAVHRLLGFVILIVAGFLFVPAAVGWGYGEAEEAWAFVLAALVTAVPGALLVLRGRAERLRLAAAAAADPVAASKVDNTRFYRREGLAVVGLSWLVAGLAGAVPYLFTDTFDSWINAFFESVSGFTTTGSTVMSSGQIDGMSHAVAFWRSFTHWLGGFGIVMVFVVLFPTGGRSLFRSEVPGVDREAAHQRVHDSALMLMRIYVGISVIECVLLRFVGNMSLFDSVLHTFGTIATGGFSNHSASVGYFDSVPVEVILTTFMFLCGFNFALYDKLLRVGPRPFWRSLLGSSEAMVYAGIALGATLLIATVLWLDGGSNGLAQDATGNLRDYRNFWQAVRDSSFTVVCMQTSTGYGTADFDAWPQFCRVLCMGLAVIGACAGSTGGGIKMVRIMIVAKAALGGVRRFVRPRAVQSIRMDGEALGEPVVASVTGYFALWVFVFMGGTLFLTAFGTDLETAGSAVLATLNNIGPGLHLVGGTQNYDHFHDLVKVVLSLFMILGRLEFYALVALCVPGFWQR